MNDMLAFSLSIEEKIAHITLNRPDQLNSLIPAFWREFPKAVAGLAEDAQVRVVVISSTGKHFTAGIDLAMLAGLGNDAHNEPARFNHGLRQLIGQLQQAFSCLASLPQPVIAAIHGGCIGAGLDMITACDMRYATRDAFFSLHEINLALVADLGTFPRLQKLIPEGIAREMAYLGERLPAARAEQLGFLNGLYDDHDALLAGVVERAQIIAAKSPLAITGSKRVLNYSRDHSTDDGLDYVATWQAGMLSEADIRAAITAQQKKQPADFPPLNPAQAVSKKL